MRKHQREILRRQAERKGVKASRFVHEKWDKLQRKKLGVSARRHNIAHGTKPKRLWRSRIA